MPVPPKAEQGEMGKFSFQSYFNFYVFLYILFSFIPKYLTLTYLLCTDVGPMHPPDFSRTRWSPQPESRPAGVVGPTTVAGGSPVGEAKRVLRWVERNLTALTRTVPMA
jgi:hypothetical protein